MVEIYNVGPEELAEYELEEIRKDERYLWVVYWYQSGSYDGDGQAYMLGKDGELYSRGLGHCSCYGPCEGWATDQHQAVKLEEFFRDKESIFDPDSKDEVKKKVAELIPWAVPPGKVFGEKFDLLKDATE